MTKAPLKLGWFSTGRGEGSYGLLKSTLDAIDSGDLNASVEFVFCNRERGQAPGSDRFMAFVEDRKVPLVTLSSRRFRREHENRPWAELREEFDTAILEFIEEFDVDLTVNAGYMLIAPLLCQRHLMINLHPALPDGPAGMWQNVIWELIEKRATETGAMVHVVTEEVDGGPRLSFCKFSLKGDDLDSLWAEVDGKDVAELKESKGESLPLFKEIRQRGVIRERPLTVETLKAVADGKIVMADIEALKPIDLTEAVESQIKGSHT